ncbi:MAG: TonB-dependent receptor [Candidatus Cloacimonetes bacterium]|nr:TonB-dependent receptor [Candidatus Cloacimonadota bacterium]
MKKVLIVLLVSFFMFTSLAFAAGAGNLAGKVTNEKTGDAIADANVYVEGTEYGMLTRNNGTFLLKNIPEGTYTVAVSYLGYELQKKEVVIKDGLTSTINFTLMIKDIGISGMTVFADRAESTTPIAYTDVPKEDIVMDLGSRDLPLVLKSSPSVYSTDQGGGAGDARVNIRGFNQRNVAIMINGVPVNDMENGWVYWSNWDGLSDATSSIQVQRGLSAVNLAVPSIGGTMNIITDPTQMTSGVNLKQEYGAGNFRKTTLVGNTGMVDDKYALSFALVRKQGDGVANGAWTDAYAYYLASAYNINDNNRLELYAVGAPQRHGQRRYLQNIATFSHKEAKKLSGLSPNATQQWLDTFNDMGWLYNQNWNTMNSSYDGEQYFDGERHERYSYSFLNEIENYYHKPQVNLNWYSKMSDKLNFYSTVYYSGGKGGGTGTFGSMKWDYSGTTRRVDWDATIANNEANDDGSKGILRNSVNTQWTIGGILKAEYEVNQELKTLFGLDWRTAEVKHYREVRDLLGGEYYYWDGDEFDTGDHHKILGDKVDYNNTNTINWLAGFAQGEYKAGPLTAFGSAGLSMVKYTFTNHFMKDPDAPTKEMETKTDWITGFQVKGGLSYIVMPELGVFGNAGYISKPPIFDEVIDDSDGSLAPDPKNEKIMSGEAGFSWVGLDGDLNIKTGGYYTLWKDQVYRQWVQTDTSGTEEPLFISGLNSSHMGVELEASYQPMDLVKFQLNASKGFWKYTDDIEAVLKQYGGVNDTIRLYVKDLKVGNQPQTQLSLAATVYPIDGLEAKIVGKYFRDFWSAWNPQNRDDPNDRKQSWKLPNFYTIDLHLLYDLPTIVKGVRFTFFAHVFNLLDEIYIQDATDNSAYSCWGSWGAGGTPKYPHTASAAEVFFGPRRSINLGVEIGL